MVFCWFIVWTYYNDVVLLFCLIMWPNKEAEKPWDLGNSLKVWDTNVVENIGKQISDTLATEKDENREINTVGNFMSGRVYGIVASSKFLSYCATCPKYGRSSESDVTMEEFKTCLTDFKKAYPEYSHYVNDY